MLDLQPGFAPKPLAQRRIIDQPAERDRTAYSAQRQLSFELLACDTRQILPEIRQRLPALAGCPKTHTEIKMRLPQARFEFQRLPQRLHGIAATPGGITRDSEVQMIFSYVGGKLHQLLVAADCVFPIFLVVGHPSRLGNLVNFALLSCACGM